MHKGFCGKIRTGTTTRSRRRWEDDIKIDCGEVGWSGVDWIDLAEDREQWGALVNMVMNLP
jgi:hypothetical protein